MYCTGNPIKYADPSGEYIEVTIEGENTYVITGGEPNNDKNIYIMENGSRTGKTLGKMLTTHSFFDDNGEIVKAIINTTDMSGQNFFDDEIVRSEIGLHEYMPNATGYKRYDFKTRGMQKNGWSEKEKERYKYRGMPFKGEGGKIFYASARDIGNFSAGYIAGIKGFSWEFARSVFDALETIQNNHSFLNFKFYEEPQVSQRAQKIGHSIGYRKSNRK